MSAKKRIAFVSGRPGLNSAKLLYMPFGLNVVQKLAEENCEIDLYLTQNISEDYKTTLPANVNPIFMDAPWVWKNGTGKGLFYALNFYFYKLSRNKSYTEVWGIGQAGTVLGGKLAHRKKVPFYYLSDEFPDVSYLQIWKENEKKYAATAKIYAVPDETRLAVTQKQVAFNPDSKGFTLPNIPLSVKSKTKINWHEKLKIKAQSKLIMYAGGIDRENNIELLLSVFPFTSPEFVLVMVGNGAKYKNSRYFKHERIVWIEENLTNDELHDLIKQSCCNICYYADFADLEYVGKSSGKLMRALLCETPVITTNFESLKFVEQDGMGVLIEGPWQLIKAINTIDEKTQWFKANIQKNIHKYFFDAYWNRLNSARINAGY